MTEMVTIKEVAELADVSPTTVSNVLHGRTQKVSPETLEKVQSILREKNYVSNMGAQILGNHGSRLIALVLAYRPSERAYLVEDPFVSSVIGSVEQAVRKYGYFMILYNNPNMDECLHMALAWNIEGMILVDAQRADYYKLHTGLKIPVLTIDTCYRKSDKEIVNVGLKDYEGAYEMTEYLIGRGHKKIAFLALMQNGFDPNVLYIDSAREQGYKDAMASHGQNVEKRWITPLKFAENERKEQLMQLVDDNYMDCTALFFASDALAIEAMTIFKDKGAVIPDDISIAGYDDIKLADMVRPRLTTIRQDFNQKGFASVDELMKLIRNGEDHFTDIRLPVQLVARETVKDIR